MVKAVKVSRSPFAMGNATQIEIPIQSNSKRMRNLGRPDRREEGDDVDRSDGEGGTDQRAQHVSIQ